MISRLKVSFCPCLIVVYFSIFLFPIYEHLFDLQCGLPSGFRHEEKVEEVGCEADSSKAPVCCRGRERGQECWEELGDQEDCNGAEEHRQPREDLVLPRQELPQEDKLQWSSPGTKTVGETINFGNFTFPFLFCLY